MTLIIFTSLSIALLCSSIFSAHPLALTVNVLLLANTICLALAHTTTWYAYILYIVMVGGILVIFTYISSLSPNGIFQLNLQLTQLVILLIPTLLLTQSTSLTPNTINTQNHHSTPQNFISFFIEDGNENLLLTLAAILLFAIFMAITLLPQTNAPIRATTFLSSCTTN